MRIDDAFVSSLMTALSRTAQGSGTGAVSGETIQAESIISADSWTGLNILFDSSLEKCLESVLALCRKQGLPEAKAVKEIIILLQKEMENIFSSEAGLAARLKREVKFLKNLSLLKEIVQQLRDSMVSAGKSREEIKPFEDFCAQCEQFESREKLFQDQGVFLFSLPDPFSREKDIQTAFYREEKGSAEEKDRACSFMLDLETGYLGKIIFFSRIKARSVDLRAQVEKERTRFCLESSIPCLKENLKEQEFVLENAVINIKGKQDPFSEKEGIEFIA